MDCFALVSFNEIPNLNVIWHDNSSLKKTTFNKPAQSSFFAKMQSLDNIGFGYVTANWPVTAKIFYVGSRRIFETAER
ncbi:MAG TPA: hypothetical protein DER39_02915 [Porphyromonadaceae bacterium]|nr:hypothetical protein [Porphyromonadaceae bacterium]